jgi:tetratricopeptide (TPR) repeat protein
MKVADSWPYCTVLLASLLSACANAPEKVAPPKNASESEVQTVKTDLMLEFEDKWHERALTAERAGRWADALVAWDVLGLLRPGKFDPELAQIRSRTESMLSTQVQRADQELKRGNLERAEQMYLAALAISPRNETVTQALRSIDRARNRRDFLGPRARGKLMKPPVTETINLALDREHLTMLISHGELGEAIGMLEKRLLAVPLDLQSRTQLADLYVQQAQTALPQDIKAAKNWLAKALKTVPTHAPARDLMRQLPALPASPASTPSLPPRGKTG